MIGVQHLATLGGAVVPTGVRVTDFVVQNTAAGGVLYAATASNGVFGFSLVAGASPTLIGQISYGPGADVFGPPRLDILDHDGRTWLLPGGRFPAELTGFSLAANGALGETNTFSDGPGGDFKASDLAVLDLGGTAWIFGAEPAAAGLAVWSIAPGSSVLTQGSGFADTASTYLTAPNVLASATIGGQPWVFAASAIDHGVTALRLGSGGTLTHAGSLGAAEGFGLNAPAALEVVQQGGQGYLIVADTGSSSLSVLRLDATGLTPTDFVIDTLSTRFQSAGTLSVLTVDDRTYIAVGGADDGVSIFRLLPDGRLFLETTIADTAGTSLADVAALQLALVGSEVQLFVASASEDGISQFRIQLGDRGLDLVGGPGAEALSGSASNDVLFGAAGDDTLVGGAGNDILIDGAGADILRGGAGADVFVLYADGVSDRIEDFDITADRLDLSDWLMLQSVGQLMIEATATGAVLRYGSEVLEILTHDGSALLPGQFNNANILNLPRPAVELIHRGRVLAGGPGADAIAGSIFADLISGGAGDDTISGGDGEDSLAGGAGADRLDGGAGSDWADYSAATGPVTVDMVTPANNRGEAQGDTYISIENVRGTALADDLRGDGGANLLEGGAANDWLTGRGGDDTLRGGSGTDNLVGGEGADLLDGGEGLDRVVYSDATSGLRVDLLYPGTNTGIAAGDIFVSVEAVRASAHDDQVYGDQGNNTLDGGTGNDVIYGRGGNDWLLGRAGNDLVDGGDGNDILLGGPGADRFVGGAGTDRVHYGDSAVGLVADLMTPANNTGIAAGDTYSGIENLQGSQGNDTLRGDGGDNMILGARGDDLIYGRGGNDFLVGLDGNDTLFGMSGDDTLEGGAGADTFVFEPGNGIDRVKDFQVGQDVLRFDPALAVGMDALDLISTYGHMTSAGATFDFGGGDVLIIRNVADPMDLIHDMVIG
ncbi:hypothetical protein OEW28_16100 [Defluviimonas sp. WL0002]|uniref:Ca2+-binding protein, RTX toxin-related n=1 Tax=Albidovulum marisflavi TaxID=2984159 RepID=A0ABT2ZGI6_9RHOB|nr:calcium-binding protein [Defluviimonas sp. WL0002]MCV2870153.1 hypothetical protein [Defluviimonas sp. WL0002]